MADPYADSYSEFLSHVRPWQSNDGTRSLSAHEMTIRHDDGLYRHLRFKKPETAMYWVELVTWPGHLYIGGDIESFTFARIPDMFEFFAGQPGRINPGYWAEKRTNHSLQVKEWSPEKFRAEVLEDIAEWDVGDQGLLRREIDEELFILDQYEWEAMSAVNDFEYREGDKVFRFRDTYEWDCKDWSIHYLRACHAIVWGIDQYRTAVSRG